MSRPRGDKNGRRGPSKPFEESAITVIEGWSTRQAYQKADEKHSMGAYCAAHDFLVPDDSNAETAPRQSVASAFVSNGTTPNAVLDETLKWVKERPDSIDITWYTTGSLVPATLRKFKEKNPDRAAATQLFLFPGRVDANLEAASGPEAEEFAKNYKGRFTYAFLSAYAFDIVTGHVYFHYSHELGLQRACAHLYAASKFLFLDSRKFVEIEGRVAYTISELIEQSRSVTIYTVSSPRSDWIRSKFEELCTSLLADSRSSPVTGIEEMKCLRLRIVGADSVPTIVDERKGFLKSHS